jgi:enoyl-CoA hydratase/carnithine racemase
MSFFCLKGTDLTEVTSYTKVDQIGKIVLDRSNRNALDLDTVNSLIDRIALSAENEDMCLVITSNGINFSVGADLKYIHSILVEEQNFAEFSKFTERFQELTRVLINHPGIVIIGLNGWVVGGGFELTLAADIRIAKEDTKILLPELAVGTTFSNGSTQLLSHTIGIGRAKELMLCGQTIDAQRAYDMGLVNQVYLGDDLESKCVEYGEQVIKNKDPSSLAIAKRLINQNVSSDIEDTLKSEMHELQKFGLQDNFKTQITEFLEERRSKK